MICDVVIDCLGRELVVIQAYPDGSYNCPSCGYAVQAHDPHCQNPCCYTRPGFPAETARRWEAERAERKRVEADRERLNAWREREAREARERETRQLAEVETTARAKGACVRCAVYSARFGRLHAPKFTKHRGPCPRSISA